MEDLTKRYSYQPVFLQAVQEVFMSLQPALDKEPNYQRYKILERIVEPERIIGFRVEWVDDKGEVQINRGYRVQYNSALGPYKGGIAFPSQCEHRHPEVPRF